jgi:hypothetical protein
MVQFKFPVPSILIAAAITPVFTLPFPADWDSAENNLNPLNYQDHQVNMYGQGTPEIHKIFQDPRATNFNDQGTVNPAE